MNPLRRIDDACIDLAQSLVAKASARTGAGKQGIIRDIHLSSGLACGLWSVGVSSAMGTEAMKAPLILCLASLMRAAMHHHLSRSEDTPGGWAQAIGRAVSSREHHFPTRMVMAASLSAIVLVNVLTMSKVLGGVATFGPAYLAQVVAPIVFFASLAVSAFVEATQPPKPDPRRKTERAKWSWSRLSKA